MTTDNNILVVRSFINQFWNGAEPTNADQFLSADYVDHAYVPNNRKGLEHTARLLHSAFPDQCSSEESILAQGDRVIVRLRMKGTHRGNFRGTEATNNPIEVLLYREFRLANGKIAEHWALLDTASLLRQIGAELHEHPACQINKS
ncbi:ester cyclase [Paenibacillus oryzisoli]|uniref:Ester cyclase n=1 Tax=Paenibacillus oryzisoli TaxID=1850517 RepID=A0A198AQR8_9BACL|nr:ester cyclase [Paenibacillus oryzisoli]OAS23617.1 hypothetical protein A8708_31750 [Paenibacillus oryzisoli]